MTLCPCPLRLQEGFVEDDTYYLGISRAEKHRWVGGGWDEPGASAKLPRAEYIPLSYFRGSA